MEIIIGLATGSLNLQIRVNGFRRAEQLQRLVNKMRSQVKPNPAPRSGQFAPTLPRFGTITVIVTFENRHLTQRAIRQQLAQSQKIPVPSSALKYGQNF